MKFIVTFILLTTTLLFGEDTERRYYVKMGAAYPPLPTFGIGARFQHGQNGFDLSANIDSLLIFNYGEIKGLYLYYPYPEEDHPVYMGIGLGVAYRINLFNDKGLYGYSGGTIPIHFVFGREFRKNHHLKTFVQLEVSQPVIHFDRLNGNHSYAPRVAAVFGLGF